MTVFSDDIFTKSTLVNSKGSVICTLRDSTGRFKPDLLRQDSTGYLTGRMVEPYKRPEWMTPGCIFNAIVQDYKLVLTLEPVVPSRIQGLIEELGEKVRFSYLCVTEFRDK